MPVYLNMERENNSILWGILGGFLLALAGMVFLAWNAWQSVDHLADDLQTVSQPDAASVQARQVVNRLNAMENSVLRFAITGDTAGLETYYRGALALPADIRRLKSIPGAPKEVFRIASTAAEIASLLESLLVAADNGLVASSFDRFAASLDSITTPLPVRRSYRDTVRVKVLDSIVVNTPPAAGAKTEAKSGFLKNLFRSRDKKKAEEENPAPPPAPERKRKSQVSVDTIPVVPPAEPATAPPTQRVIDEIRTSAEVIRERENQRANEKALQVLALTAKIDEQARKMAGLVAKTEQKRRSGTEEVASAANLLKQKTLNRMALMGAGVSIVFAVLLGIIFHDIRLNRRLNRRLREEKQLTEALSKAKEVFLTRISHDLRTPMHAVIGFSEQLSQTPLTSRQAGFLEHIRAASAYLLALLNDVLDLAKFQHEGFSLEKKAFSLRKLTDETAALFRERAKEKGLAFHLHWDPAAPEVVVGDALRLRQMLFNLLGNAIKFTETGSITLEIRSQDPEKGVLFVIKDTGIGIAPEKIPSLFEEFSAAGEPARMRYGGHGLGLSITRKLATLHGGTLHLESQPGAGVTVQLNLPYETAGLSDLPEEVHATFDQGVPQFHGLKVLVADDEPFNRELLRTVLEKWNLVPLLAANGREALVLAEDEAPAMGLLDLHMPEMDGIEVARQLKARYPDMPLLGLTAAFGPEEEARGLEAGFSAYLLKPFREDALLEKMLSLPGIQPPAYVAGTSIPKKETGTSLGEKYPLLSKNGDEAFLRRMLSLFVKNGTNTVAAMDAAAEARQAAELGEAAHKWLPSCRQLGLAEAVDILQSIENTALRSGQPEESLGIFTAGKPVLMAALAAVKADVEG